MSEEYVAKRRKLSGWLFESALPNEYLVRVGARRVKPVIGGRRFRWFGIRKFIRIPASIQMLEFATDNANVHFQGLGIEGFASWQINPANPEVAVSTLDLFDEDDPMARTNTRLQLICVEAVRHVIANMTIDEAHRKKEDIAANLAQQLRQIETKWGIVFHHVGIRQVRVMSAAVFNDLQAKFRNELRLEASRTRIDADKKIAAEENAAREKTETEKMASDQALALVKQANGTKRTEIQLADQESIAEKEHDLAARKADLEASFKKEHALALLDLAVKIADIEKSVAERQAAALRVRRDVEQSYTEEALTAELVRLLPQIAEKLKVNNYTVLTGEGAALPFARLVEELFALMKNRGKKPDA